MERCLTYILSFLCFTLASVDQAGGTSGDDLRFLESDFYRWRQMDVPEYTSLTGVHIYDSTVDDFSMGELERRKSKVDDFHQRLSAVDQTRLTTRESYNYIVFNDTLLTFLNNYKWRFYGPLNPLNFLEGDHVDLTFRVEALKFSTIQDFENYISRLNLWPAKFQQYIRRFKTAVKIGHTSHRVSVDKIPGQIQELLVSNPEMSVFYKPFARDLYNLSISDEHKKHIRSQGRQGVKGLLDGFSEIKTYIEQEYLYYTRRSYGVLGLQDGKEYYLACLRWHLSIDMTPEEVYLKGTEEVTRIEQNIRQIMAKRKFRGTIAEFYKELTEQPRFHLNSADKLLQMYRDMIYKRIYPQLLKAFKNIPNMKVRVVPMTNDGPGGSYVAGTADGSRPGTFLVNLHRPNETHIYAMMALALHETVPGHHLQGIFALTADLPEFQRELEDERYYEVPQHFSFYTAYTEGWGLYAESLGEYLGIYKDDDELLGRYGEEIFRAARLIVDTGIHYYGWTRAKAIRYMLEHTPIVQSDAEIEIDRYITWPGQACAYKIGELKIKELRSKAMKELGSKFDIRDYHSQILENGPVPLKLLEEIITNWIQQVKRNNTMSTVAPIKVPITPNFVG